MPPTPTPGRKRPHPARSARQLAGWLSIAAMAGLTGGMVNASRTATTTTSTRSTAGTVAATVSDDDASPSARSSVNASAVAGSASSQPVTVSHAS